LPTVFEALIAHAHGGTIEAESSAEDRTTTITVRRQRSG